MQPYITKARHSRVNRKRHTALKKKAYSIFTRTLLVIAVVLFVILVVWALNLNNPI